MEDFEVTRPPYLAAKRRRTGVIKFLIGAAVIVMASYYIGTTLEHFRQ